MSYKKIHPSFFIPQIYGIINPKFVVGKLSKFGKT